MHRQIRFTGIVIEKRRCRVECIVQRKGLKRRELPLKVIAKEGFYICGSHVDKHGVNNAISILDTSSLLSVIIEKQIPLDSGFQSEVSCQTYEQL